MNAIFFNKRTYFLFSLSCIAIGLSVSKPLISLGLICLSIVWLIDGNPPEKLKSFFSNKIALVLSSIFLLSLLGLLYTNNFNYAFGDLRRKMFLFFIPFLLSGFSPLTKKEFHLILKIYIAGVLTATFWSLFVYFGGLHITIVDSRSFSRFNSHIRFGLEIALAIFFSFYYLYYSSKITLRILWLSISIWLITSLFLFDLFTGTIIFFITVSILSLVFGFLSTNKRLKILLISLLSILFIFCFVFIKDSIDDFYACNNVKPLEEVPFTDDGNPYIHYNNTNSNTYKENGFLVEKNICWNEIEASWNERSTLDFNGKDLKNQELKNTLIRFITSKGLRKDKKAIKRLTDKEVEAIENGIPNNKYLTMNRFRVRLHKIIWEYDSYKNGRDINGHSVLMRWEYWKTAIRIIKNNFFIGVGTGDVQAVFNLQYEKENSVLAPQYRLRAHNQYLTYGVTFGVIGVICFFIFLFYPIFKTKMYKNYFYLAFFSIVLLSMLTEDTLETQVGINFFVFFNTVLAFRLKAF